MEMMGEPILTETRHGGNDPPVINGLEDLPARVGQELGVGGLGSEDMKGSTFTRHQPRNVRQLCVVADHQPAQRGHPVHRRGEAAPGGGGDAIAIHPTGIIGLVYDHRAFDGSTASLFLMHIRDSLEQRNWEPEVC
jgi:pyruvate/2-oxoglutarate dehydrogenase complex dihydrolipoamide acyltransferase (E2) component